MCVAKTASTKTKSKACIENFKLCSPGYASGRGWSTKHKGWGQRFYEFIALNNVKFGKNNCCLHSL